jgi:ElaB/YqjD/DUF883 family membrane-anchored ribosome-binding protein
MDKATREGSAQLTGQQSSPEPEEIRQEIADTREELGETVEALAQKTDVKGHAKAKVAERKEALAQKQDEAKAKVSDVRDKVTAVTPEQAKQSAAHVAERARERPVPTAAAGALVLGIAIGFVLGRR